ncbi:Vps62-related protein [Desulfococcaceae bacterium HSG8]|nr:Vps62-related protein [Desulfococcaceae bacterium HSG8]
MIELIEDIFNRPFGILLIISGLVFLFIVVLFRLNDIENKIAEVTGITIGGILILSGAIIHLWPATTGEPDISVIEQPSEVLPESPPFQPESQEETAEPEKKVYLRYTLITEFELVWNDKESGMKQKVAFYQPLPPVGYKIFGHYAQNDYGRPKGRVIAVKPVSEMGDEGILAYPMRYERIWQDSDVDGAIWRPVPPLGYRCLGDVATTGRSKPGRKEVVCVKASLVTAGQIGELIWDNRGKDALYDVRVYSVLPKEASEGTALNLFQGYGRQWYRKPGADSLPVLKKGSLKGGG